MKIKNIAIFILFLCFSFYISSNVTLASDINYNDITLSDLKDGSEIIKYNENGEVEIFNNDADKEEYNELHSSANEEKKFLEKYKSIIIFVSGMALITMIIVFIVMCAKLGALGENPVSRQKVVIGILVDGLCIAALGSLLLLYGVFYGFFNTPDIDNALRFEGWASEYNNPYEDPNSGAYRRPEPEYTSPYNNPYEEPPREYTSPYNNPYEEAKVSPYSNPYEEPRKYNNPYEEP